AGAGRDVEAAFLPHQPVDPGQIDLLLQRLRFDQLAEGRQETDLEVGAGVREFGGVDGTVEQAVVERDVRGGQHYVAVLPAQRTYPFAHRLRGQAGAVELQRGGDAGVGRGARLVGRADAVPPVGWCETAAQLVGGKHRVEAVSVGDAAVEGFGARAVALRGPRAGPPVHPFRIALFRGVEAIDGLFDQRPVLRAQRRAYAPGAVRGVERHVAGCGEPLVGERQA